MILKLIIENLQDDLVCETMKNVFCYEYINFGDEKNEFLSRFGKLTIWVLGFYCTKLPKFHLVVKNLLFYILKYEDICCEDKISYLKGLASFA